ncbi:MAG TPA: hypothetical protein VFA44_03955 [Gaiellaceae bacterium]|nr:hypothetical protein [Gaiellaceae bacterium]
MREHPHRGVGGSVVGGLADEQPSSLDGEQGELRGRAGASEVARVARQGASEDEVEGEHERGDRARDRDEHAEQEAAANAEPAHSIR